MSMRTKLPSAAAWLTSASTFARALGERKIHAELRQLEGNVAVDFEVGDFVERPQIGLPGGRRFFQ